MVSSSNLKFSFILILNFRLLLRESSQEFVADSYNAKHNLLPDLSTLLNEDSIFGIYPLQLDEKVKSLLDLIFYFESYYF